ncbi:helix-turn-helix domain-containing protein [Dorea acetigenes]|uniref:Helix-turn-helix domain-containing protein n=1 Tax=Dorea acetigenes TaxID=2981787 RepID=A0ABT2RIQ7_9FIRM|nr:helix-turn-helix transcriptional regulator [Dorea acetigenes]MCU6685302.1 helix-turn-helix domain-containing protein [Dorea acetigenes]SCI43243.1 Antitoxin PezA [uncultured Clostridium sp.]
MKERLRLLRKSLDITQQEFADRIGIKRNSYANYETGRNTPIDAIILSICREFGVNETWLRTGEGEMFEEITEQEKLMKYAGLLLKDKDSAVANAIQALIVTYEQLDDTSKSVLEKIALQYVENLKKSQQTDS